MPPLHPQPPTSRTLTLTLIVATTPVRTTPSPTPETTTTTTTTTAAAAAAASKCNNTRLGIGHRGTLPWPRIKTDMSFFARVTSRPPAPGKTNAIIMGRKTYDSLPRQLRPLSRRINVVVTRNGTGSVKEGILRELEVQRAKMRAKQQEKEQEQKQKQKQNEEEEEDKKMEEKGPAREEPITDALIASSMHSALDQLESTYGQFGKLGNIFVIGGAEIYAAALRMGHQHHPQPGHQAQAEPQHRPSPRLRIVMTNVRKTLSPKPTTTLREGQPVDGADESQFECDAFFPEEDLTMENGWRVATPEEVTGWVGEEVSSEWTAEQDVAVQMVGYERISMD